MRNNLSNTNIYNEQLLSKTITYLRFPLIILVVLLHTIIIDQNCFGKILIPHGKYPIFDIILHILQRNIGDISVPLFFFISGFLFFYHIENFDIAIYKKKILKRIKSLLIPYLLWNSLFFLYLFIFFIYFPSFIKSFNEYFSKLTVISFIKSYWSFNGSPILAPMWFIRDLMFLNIISPIIYWILRKTKLTVVTITFILFITGFCYEVPLIGGRIWFPYIWGAFFSINKINFLNTFNKYKIIICISYFVLIIIDTWLVIIEQNSIIINHLSLIFGITCILLLNAYLLKKEAIHENPYIAKASFFVFGFHMFIINIPNKLFPLLIPINTLSAIIMQISIPIIVSFICLFIYYVIDKYLPKLSIVLVGGR